MSDFAGELFGQKKEVSKMKKGDKVIFRDSKGVIQNGVFSQELPSNQNVIKSNGRFFMIDSDRIKKKGD
jgi:hypothetical protein